ncbi:Heterokaryon incompatibility protein 6 OR allele [Lachnellula suecica]|uniref:Heterokaryon incompatibility protein 6 OR allele n=1 Tax=Lachnellula suecica TaxID=602035 RepID=A0A8T9C1Q8_9HELO|nr:Heterokaryon incompatibility protein 6 OR allele [Lachnellula suecica]
MSLIQDDLPYRPAGSVADISSPAVSSDPPLAVTPSQSPELVYQYEPLDATKNEIRLLRILPIRVVDGQECEVECSLFVTPLNDAPPYEALSYTWGEHLDLQDIFLDDLPFKVTPSLQSALWQLQGHSEERLFWVDALCINQGDDQERGEQVSKMRTIYERATNVVVWLGNRSVRTSRAFALFEDLHEHILDKKYVYNVLRDRDNLDTLDAMGSILDRDYWKRIWVIQEVNSAKKATIMCGKYLIDLPKVKAVQGALWRDHDRYLIQQAVDERIFSLFQKSILYSGPIALEVSGFDPPSSFPDLFTALSEHQFKRASDPRDQVYALVGLTTAREDARFEINYSKSVGQVYIDVVKYIIISSKRLDIITSLHRGDKQYDLPSWVPDWTINDTKTASLPSITIANPGDRYSSAGTSIAEAELKAEDRILVAKGILLSPIKTVGLKMTTTSSDDFKASIPIILEWYRLCSTLDGTLWERVDAFCRTIFYNRISELDLEGYDSPLELMKKIAAAIAVVAEDVCPGESVDRELVDLKNESSVLKWWAKSWMKSAGSTIIGRRFFLSDSNLMGMCPNSAEPGDIICILLGCWVPVVLRPEGDHYIYLGEAYVHEYMYGKGMDELEEGKFQLQEFEIH